MSAHFLSYLVKRLLMALLTIFLVIAISMSKKINDAEKDNGLDRDIGLSTAPDRKFICKACGSYKSR